MTRDTNHPHDARSRRDLTRRSSPLIAVAALAIYVATSALGPHSDTTSPEPDLDPESAALDASGSNPTTDPDPIEDSAARIVDGGDEDDESSSVPTPALPKIVGDPTPGDMRFNPNADALPVSYEPRPATAVINDLSYGPDPAQGIDLYLPDEGNAPVVLFLHSGGWLGGDEDVVPDIALRFVERGYAVASVGYRLAPDNTFPAPVTDVKSAIHWLKAYGAAEGVIDGDRIVLMGTSAGGHLAAFVGATVGDFEPQDMPADQTEFDSSVVGVVSIVGPTDLVQLYDQENPWARGITTAFVGCYPCDADQLLEPSIAPRLHHDLPPAYWAYGVDDVLIDFASQGIATATAWSSAAGEGSSWIDLVEGADHNLDEALINMRALETFVDQAVDID